MDHVSVGRFSRSESQGTETRRQQPDAEGGATVLDLLEREDRALRHIFADLRTTEGQSVEERAEYGDLAKSLIRRVSSREAALVDVEKAVADVPELSAILHRFEQQRVARRRSLDRVEKMSRGVQSIILNTGQEFDAELTELTQLVGTEIDWDLDEAVPAVRHALERRGRMSDLSSATTVARRAPTNLSPDGPRWYEGAPLISRIIAIYDSLRDFPRARHKH
jgi:hypothetical protein